MGGIRSRARAGGAEAGARPTDVRLEATNSDRAAIAVAELEAAEDAWSTWFLMTRSVFYNLDSSEGEATLERLRGLGHRVALTGCGCTIWGGLGCARLAQSNGGPS